MKWIEVEGMSVAQFEYRDIGVPRPWHKRHSFSCGMIGTCHPLFDDCFGNVDVEIKLRNAKVIRKNNATDSESCALWVYFSKRESGEKFIDRLNVYLVEKTHKLEEARRY